MQSGHLFCSCLVHSAVSRDSVMKYKSTISLARNFLIWFWSSHLNMWVVPVLHVALGSFFISFHFQESNDPKEKGGQCWMFLSSLMLLHICVYFSLGTFGFYAFGDGCSWCTCNVQTANLETCICKQRNWKHNISIILLSQLYQKGQDRFPRY